MYECFGAVVDQKKVEFKLFFPDSSVDSTQYVIGGSPRIEEIRVRGDFQSKIGGQDWDFNTAPVMEKTPHPNGWLYTYKIDKNLPDGFYQYKYFVTFENETTRWCSDPCTKYSSGKEENAAFIIGGNTCKAESIKNRLPQKKLILYEMMMDNFTAQYRKDRAPVDAVHEKIDYLVDLGINTIEFMPWTGWPGKDFNWGFEPFLFFSVENSLVYDKKNPLDKLYKLKRLINALHDKGIHVILDGVFNHVSMVDEPGRGFPYHMLYQNPADSPFTGKFSGAMFLRDLDFNNKCTQEFITDVCKYWLDEFQIDGFRFDYTPGFYIPDDDQHGITKLISDLKAHSTDTGKSNIALIIEHLTGYEGINDTNKICALGNWFDQYIHDFAFPSIINWNIETKIIRVLNASLDFAEGKGPITYIEQHDHSTLVNKGGGRDLWYKTQPYAIALLTGPGTPMIHNGQEFGEDYFLPGSGAERVIPRPLRWKEHSTDFTGQRLFFLYKRLIQIRKEHPSIRSSNFYPWPYDENQTHFDSEGYGVNRDKDVLIFHRWGNDLDGLLERFIIILNFSGYDQYTDIPFSVNGQWDDLINSSSVHVTNYRLYNQRINSNWGRIYYKKEY